MLLDYRQPGCGNWHDADVVLITIVPIPPMTITLENVEEKPIELKKIFCSVFAFGLTRMTANKLFKLTKNADSYVVQQFVTLPIAAFCGPALYKQS